MENFILYEELGAGCNSVVYKGRRKGNLNYVAIICSKRIKKPEIANHVRFSYQIDHPNIVHFYEWYETSNHIWMVVELCTGGSLHSVVSQDGSLPEDVVRKFGWDLVQGLKHIHDLGIIFCYLNPTKILLDDSGTLKLGSFCLSKAEGETLNDLFTVISTSEEDDSKEGFFEMRRKLQGSSTYCAPEVLLESERSISSDLWALGCILWFMYTGKPPFYSDCPTEQRDMILHRDPPPLRQTVSLTGPPSQDFQNLLKALLNKNPHQRIEWPELLGHSFWKELQKNEELVMEIEEDDDDDEKAEQNSSSEEVSVSPRHTRIHNLSPSGQAEQSFSDKSQTSQIMSKKLIPSHVTTDSPSDKRTESQQSIRHMHSKASRKSQEMDKKWVKDRSGGEGAKSGDDPRLTEAERVCHTRPPNRSFASVSELRPKSGVDEDNTEGIFLLSSCANSRKSCSTSDSSSQKLAPQATAGTDIICCMKSLLYTEADLTVTPVIDNPKILKSAPIRFDPKTLCVSAYSVEKLLSLNDEEWYAFVSQLCSLLEEQSSTTSSMVPPPSTAVRSRLNLLCYLCCVVGHKVIANRLINSTLLQALTQQLRQASNWDVRSKVLRVMGLLALHCSDLGEDSNVSEAVSTLTDLLRDNLRNSKIKQFLLPPLGEFLYLISSQEEKRGSPEGLWFVPAAAYTGLMRSLREGDDPVVHHMAAKAIENVATTVSDPSHHLANTEIGSTLWYLFTHSTVEAVRVTAISALSRLTRVVPAVFLIVIDTCGPAAIFEAIGGAGARVQQHLLTVVAAALLASCIQTHRFTQSKDLVLKVLRCLESPSTLTRAKALLLLLILVQDNTHILLYCCQQRHTFSSIAVLSIALPLLTELELSDLTCLSLSH